MSNLETYGLTEQDLLQAQWKIAKQKKYLESQTFLSAEGKEKNLLDVSYSANLSERYYSRILNKVDTFVSTSITKGLTPIFLTVTADGFFRDMLKGDYTRFTPKKVDAYRRYIPNNKRNGFYWDYISQGAYSDLATKKSYSKKLTSKDIYKILAHQMHKFYMCETLRHIKKDGFNYTSIRVTEPHKDGVPHYHILMYVPEQYVSRLYHEFKRFFPAPRNHVPLTKKNTRGTSKRNGELICKTTKMIKGKIQVIHHHETHGFQTKIRSAAGYILKYILKSFTNLIDGEELDYLQAWYVHNRIPRIITTHTLVSQEVYHKVAMMEDDWHYLTDIKHNGIFENDRLNSYFRFNDGCGREIIGDNGLYTLTNQGRLIHSFGSKENFIPTYRSRSFDFKIFGSLKPPTFNILQRYNIYIPHKQYKFYIVKKEKDGTIFSFVNVNDFSLHHIYELGISYDKNGEFQGFADVFNHDIVISDYDVPVVKLSDNALYTEYSDFDFDTKNPARYAMLHNELIDRNMLRADYVKVNDYNDNFFKEANYIMTYSTPKPKIRDLDDIELQKQFKELNFFDDEARYCELSREMNKRNLL